MPIPIPDKETVQEMKEHILLICEKLHIPVLKARCAKEGVWFYVPSSPHRGLWMHHYAYEYFLAQGEKTLKFYVALMLRH